MTLQNPFTRLDSGAKKEAASGHYDSPTFALQGAAGFYSTPESYFPHFLRGGP